MPLSLQALRCPHCGHRPSKAEQREAGYRKALLARKPLSCPKCNELCQLPSDAEQLISTGLACCMLIAPLLAFWQTAKWPGLSCFALGLLLIIVGAAKQQLQKATPQACDTNEQTPTQEPNHD